MITNWPIGKAYIYYHYDKEVKKVIWTDKNGRPKEIDIPKQIF